MDPSALGPELQTLRAAERMKHLACALILNVFFFSHTNTQASEVPSVSNQNDGSKRNL